MKKLFLALLAVGTLGTASAQKKGDVFVYGSLSYEQNTDKNGSVTTKTNTIGLNPGIGYQISDHIGVGLNVDYTNTSNEVSGGTSKSSQLALSAFGRYTHNISNLFFVYGQLNAGYLSESDNSGAPGAADVKSNGFGVRAFPAIGVNITRSFAITGNFGGIGYSSVKLDESAVDASTSNFTVNLGRTFGFGIQWNIPTGRRAATARQPMEETRRMNTANDEDDEDMPKRRQTKDTKED